MRIIQLSDFHISSKINLDECKTKISILCECINQECNNTEKLVFILCGDVTDGGSVDGYENAKILFDLIKLNLVDKQISYEFVPGNHDLCGGTFSDFDKFITLYSSDEYRYEESGVVLKEYDDINIILANSVSHRDHSYGKLPLEELLEALAKCKKPIVIVMHHTLMSRYEGDFSAITNTYKFIELIEKHNVIAVLHGHTHGYSDINVSKECRIIGVGPFFKKVDDVNNQYNMISIVANQVQQVDNYRYSSDIDKFVMTCLYRRQNINIFSGLSTSEVYESVRNATFAHSCIYNLSMNVQTKFSDFIVDMEKSFINDIEKAKDWQSLEVPKTLYYNHGQYMRAGDSDGISHVISELNNKATSSRAIIPLINFNDVSGSGDNFLPSLDIIQFGFSNEEKTELFCTLYLRALEVNHFLKINLSEIYIMSIKIKESIRSISKINITILAFKAQYKEKYSCFRRAELDMLEERTLMKIVIKRQILIIKDLVKEKFELSETIVNTQGIIYLYNCLKEDDNDDNYYSSELIDSCYKLMKDMEFLKKECEKTSNYEEISKIEVQVSLQMEDLLNKIGVMEGLK
ncbi:metallophosphoesterase [Desulfosporosinus fructosivorans]|uniref:Metallophosphoesterase n=1 Tax=Desulfosporosinus fructosivorans TaxID=2018669 RepID=A0A4Z0R8E8_9FIRM|nr:metallophosphoesterase [Desulfosporosinus fructosivorans]TGE38704.1 metallophosphoesterase [Desulfosporosinus fructosivorans]